MFAGPSSPALTAERSLHVVSSSSFSPTIVHHDAGIPECPAPADTIFEN
jgi:hypothetical protein